MEETTRCAEGRSYTPSPSLKKLVMAPPDLLLTSIVAARSAVLEHRGHQLRLRRSHPIPRPRVSCPPVASPSISREARPTPRSPDPSGATSGGRSAASKPSHRQIPHF
ncbi:hypothetical protein E2562_023261 [Oryza meyeriana var. granulata]|uniref:Uncharacterized protein n=1 Tax=Oryza meyeriana var. granulata TaxID=110450 RepID=A0A6G1DM55_9ORYZ|nr:hypothetical protein E2562_023261 [Oryza meyeriana var. granulata]